MDNLTEHKVEECMHAIKTIRGLLHRPYELGQIIRNEAYTMIGAINAMKQTGMQNGSTDLDRLKDLLENVCCLTNQIDGAGLIVNGNKTLEAAYQRLP